MSFNRDTAPRPAQASSEVAKLENLFRQEDAGKDELMRLAEKYADSLRHLKTNQLRNLPEMIIWVKTSHKGTLQDEISQETRGRLAVCRPRLAYMAARENKLKELRAGLNNLLEKQDAFKKGADLDRLYDFTSAIVAYHKYFLVEDEKRSR